MSENKGLIMNQQQQQDYQTFESETALQEIIIDERNQELEKIKSDFIEVNKLSTEIHNIVFNQSEYVDNIENNIIYSKNNVDRATKDILAAEKQQKKCSMCGCNICTFLLIIALLLFISIVIIAFVMHSPSTF